MADNILEVGIVTTGADQAAEQANLAAQGINNVGTSAEQAAGQTSQLGEATEETGSILQSILNLAKEVGSSFLGMGRDAVEAGAEIKESMAEAGESLAEIAEKANFASGSISTIGGVGALGGVLGLGAAFGLVAEAIENTAEKAEHLRNLGEASGTSAGEIAALIQALRLMGTSVENADRLVVKLATTQEEATQGDKRAIEALNALGIGVKDNAITALEKYQNTLKDTGESTSTLAFGQQIFGRGIVQITGALKGSEESLSGLVAKQGDLKDAFNNAMPAVEEQNRLSAELSKSWNIFVLQVLPSVNVGVKSIAEVFITFKEILAGLGGVIIATGETIVFSIVGAAQAAWDATHGNLAAAKEDFANAGRSIKDSWKGVVDEIKADNKEAEESTKALWNLGGEKPDGGKNNVSKSTPLADPKALEEARKALEQKEQIFREESEINDRHIKDLEAHGHLSADAAAKALDEQAEAERAGLLKLNAQRVAVGGENQAPKIQEDYKKQIQEISDAKADANQKELTELDKLKAEIDKSIAEQQAKSMEASAKKLAEEQAVDALIKKLEEEHVKDHQKAVDEMALADLEASRKKIKSEEEVALAQASHDPAAQRKIIEQYSAELQKIDEEIAKLRIRNAERDSTPQNREQNVAKATAEGNATKQGDADQAQQQIAKLDTAWKELEKNLKVGWNDIGKEMGQALVKMDAAFGNSIAKWATGQEKFSKAMIQSLRSIETQLISSLVQMGLKWVEHYALVAAENALFGGEKKAQDTVTNEAAVLGSAAVAGAGATAWWSPLVGPAAIPLGAEQMATVLATYTPIAAAEQGMLVGNQEQMTLLHPNEMVLPKKLSEGVQNMVNKDEDGSGGGDHIHVHFMDAHQANDFINRNRDKLHAAVKDAVKSGRK